MGCYTDGKGLWVCTGSGRHYVVRTHTRGHRHWTVISRHRAYLAAVKRMAAEFAVNRHLNRADVLLCAEYYDPEQVVEITRRP